MPKTVDASEELHPLIEKIEVKMDELFNNMKKEPKKGRIMLGDSEYMLINLQSIAVDMKKQLAEILDENGVNLFMYRFGKTFGETAAKCILPLLNLDNVVEKVTAGPIFAGYAGFVHVKLLPSNITADENFLLFHEHPNNFESAYWKKEFGQSNEPICYFNAGYSAGWCSIASGVSLDATEVLCEAKGDKVCRFITYPSSREHEYLENISKYQE